MSIVSRDQRRAQLSKKTKRDLVLMCRAGVMAPDGGRVVIEGGMYPVSSWDKLDIIASILSVEYPPDVTDAGLYGPGALPGRDQYGPADMTMYDQHRSDEH